MQPSAVLVKHYAQEFRMWNTLNIKLCSFHFHFELCSVHMGMAHVAEYLHPGFHSTCHNTLHTHTLNHRPTVGWLWNCSHKICVQIAYTSRHTPTEFTLFRLKYCARRKSATHRVAFRNMKTINVNDENRINIFGLSSSTYSSSSFHGGAPALSWAKENRQAIMVVGESERMSTSFDCNCLILKLTHFNINSCIWKMIVANALICHVLIRRVYRMLCGTWFGTVI